ncbi:hypothetical protein L0B53_03970 [Vibrio sp. SS-MA-C1-2]|uniref:hypothetical protein n=1 Tax=Vibrio sp. SS-MA-C1-2 TaxID=2908646 RepID=UPI001F399C92|nr:hypothetical protein [Vibrio sp. SS-MA-C1-2]UJF17090.1 hypothetical protein L0B53_03970 [Vibrio sp. SS-MA-C1-2]
MERKGSKYLLILLSGFFSLIYQTIWVKQLALVIGIDIYATSVVISGFFTGLAIGSYYFAKQIQSVKLAKYAYVALEFKVAIFSIILSLILYKGSELYLFFDPFIGKAVLLIFWILIAIPAFFMAGTLLAMLKHVEQTQGNNELSAGRLYGINIIGAVLGTLSTPFLLIPIFGVIGTALAASISNILLAVLALFILTSKEQIDPPNI